jgi:hypothetical protein
MNPAIIAALISLVGSGINAYSNSGKSGNDQGGGKGELNDFLYGGPDNLTKFKTGTPQMEQLQNFLNQYSQQQLGGGQQGNQMAQQYHQGMLGPEAFEKFSQPYLQQFNEQVVPGIAERFAGMGALSSSGFGQSLGGAASGLQSNLAQLFSQLQGQSANSLFNQYNAQQGQGLNAAQQTLGWSPFGYQQNEGNQGGIWSFLSSLGPEILKSLPGIIQSYKGDGK